jgi:hypothetical protein
MKERFRPVTGRRGGRQTRNCNSLVLNLREAKQDLGAVDRPHQLRPRSWPDPQITTALAFGELILAVILSDAVHFGDYVDEDRTNR